MDVLGYLTWTPPSEITFGTFSGTPNRYKFISTSSAGTFEFFATQNQAGTLNHFQLYFVRGLDYHIECIPQYLGVSFFNAPQYFSGKAVAVDITIPDE